MKNWEKKFKQLSDLRGRSNGLLFDRAKLLVEICDDPEFLEFHGGDLDKATDMLDAECGDYGLTYYDLRTMLKHFPQRSQWEQGKLRKMLAEALESVERERRERAVPVKQRRISRQEFEAVREERDTAERQSKEVAAKCETLEEEIARLTEENRELRDENQRLRGRIEGLERLLSREVQSV